MKAKRGRPVSKGPRRLRERPIPRWLKTKELDEMAKRRCLLILSVLSGTTPVSEAIAEAKISRGTYYQLETRAMNAMLQALMPGAETSGAGEPLALQMARSEARIKRLEREKRRTERLLYLTRKVLKPGPVKTDKGPRKRRGRKSRADGKAPSTSSKRTGILSPPDPSTPTLAGTAAR